jgi:hypothetical protein
MGLLDLFRKKKSASSIPVLTPEICAAELRQRPVMNDLTERFGAEVTEAIIAAAAESHVRDVVIKRVGPFAYVEENATHDRPQRFVTKGKAAVRFTGVHLVPDIVAEAQPDMMKDHEHFVQTLRALAVTIVTDRSQLQMPPHRGSPAISRAPSERLLQEFEPPHFQGRAFIVFVFNNKQTYKIRVDAESLAVDVEHYGYEPHIEYMPIPGRAYLADDGSQVVAALNAPTESEDMNDAAYWRKQALIEHASIASFARTSMELLAVGAPLDLIRRTHEAALDEIEHTQQCLAIAESIDGQHIEMGPLEPLAPRSGDRHAIAERALTEAAYPEREAANDARRRASLVDDALRVILLKQADDEDRHAQLAFDVAEWARR